MTTYILNVSVKLNSLFDSKMKDYYVTQVLKQDIYNIKTMCPYYILEL